MTAPANATVGSSKAAGWVGRLWKITQRVRGALASGGGVSLARQPKELYEREESGFELPPGVLGNSAAGSRQGS